MSAASPPEPRDDDGRAVAYAWANHEDFIALADNPRALAMHVEPVLDELAHAILRNDETLADSRRVEPWLACLEAAQSPTMMDREHLRAWLRERIVAVREGHYE